MSHLAWLYAELSTSAFTYTKLSVILTIACTLFLVQVEHELNVCRKKLHSVQVERNLLMVS